MWPPGPDLGNFVTIPRKPFIFRNHFCFGCSYPKLQQLDTASSASAETASLWKATAFSCPGVGVRKAPLRHLHICRELRKPDGNRWAAFPQPVLPLGSAAAWVVWHASEMITIALKLILNQRLYRGFCQPKQKHLQSERGPSGVRQKWKFPQLLKYTWNSWNCFGWCSCCWEVML